MGAGYLTDYSSAVDKVSESVDSVFTDTGEQKNETSTVKPVENVTYVPRPIGEFGGVQTNKTFIYNGKKWEPKADLTIARDRPACSIVHGKDGQVKYTQSSMSTISVYFNSTLPYDN